MAGCQYVQGKEDDAKIGNYLNLYPGVHVKVTKKKLEKK